jgi:hypothetical protein
MSKMANHKRAEHDRRTLLVGFKASEVDLAVLDAAQDRTGLSTKAEVIRNAVRLQYADLYAAEKSARVTPSRAKP